jgi:hypothetical protein
MISKYYKNDYPWEIQINQITPSKSYQNFILSKVYIKSNKQNNIQSYKQQLISINRLSRPKLSLCNT